MPFIIIMPLEISSKTFVWFGVLLLFRGFLFGLAFSSIWFVRAVFFLIEIDLSQMSSFKWAISEKPTQFQFRTWA